MLVLHTGSALDKLRESGRVVALVHRELKKEIVPGITTKYLNDLAEEIMLSEKALPAFKGYKQYPFATCCSVNEEIVHGFPNDRKLLEGDLLTVDVGVLKDGYISDAAFSIGVGKVKKETTDLIEASYEALDCAISAIKEGVTTGTVGNIIEACALRRGFNVVKNFTGHGCGRTLHEFPQILNYGRPKEGVVLKEGASICIEPILIKGPAQNKRLSDGWTIISNTGARSCHVEHHVIVHKGFAEVITI